MQVKTFLIPSKSMRVKVKRNITSALFVQIASFIMISNGLEILNRHSLLLKLRDSMIITTIFVSTIGSSIKCPPTLNHKFMP